MNKKKPYNSRENSDDQIKDLFQNYQVPLDPHSWDSLSQKMDNALPFVSLIDSEIQDDLASVKVPFDSASWHILAQRLDLFDNRKKWILKGKLIELAMFFFVFYLFTESLNQPLEFKQSKIEFAIEDPLPFKSVDSEKLSENSDVKAALASIAPTQNSQSDNLSKASGSFRNKQTQFLKANESESLLSKAINKSDESSSGLPHHSIPVVSEMNTYAEHLKTETQNSLSTISESQHITEKYLIKDEQINLDKLPLPKAQVEQENLEQNDFILPVLYPGNFNDKKFSFLIGAVIGYDKDLIKSPFPHQKSEVMLGRIEDNFRMGLNLHMDMNAVEISTGLHYLIKNYKSVYAGENQVRIVQIPIMMKLKLPFAGFMRGYVAGGVSGNYVIHANYAEHDYFRDRPQLDYIENNSRAAGYSLLSSSSYKNGIFEGETIRGNHFYTANIAIGLEAHLNTTYSLFFEQAYSHHLKGSAIGPAFDHFFSSTTLLGIRYRILKNSNRILHAKTGNLFR